MKVEFKKLDDVTHKLTFEVSKEEVTKVLDGVYKDLAKETKIKGFRRGKIPRGILEKRYGVVAKDEMLKQVVQNTYQEGIMKEKLEPLDYPDIQDVNYKEGLVTFTAKVEVKPDVKVKDYKGIKIKRKSSEVTDEDIEKTLEYFKQGQGEGKDVVIDDVFAKGFGYPSLEEFKKSLSRQIAMDKDRQNKSDVESQISEFLLKKGKLTIPQSLVRKQIEYRIEEHKKRWQQQGVSGEDLEKKEEEMRKELKSVVEKDVSVYLIFDKIAQCENIKVGEKENLSAKVMEFLLKHAIWEGNK